MLALWGDAPLSVTQLSHLLALDPGTLSPLLKRLEAAGYVTREREHLLGDRPCGAGGATARCSRE
jgi:DNA-binding MarR family transcriptional regulator